MLCPKCGVELLASDREGIEIDCCPQCGGIWLDHGELMEMINVYAPQFAAYQAAPFGSGDQTPKKNGSKDK